METQPENPQNTKSDQKKSIRYDQSDTRPFKSLYKDGYVTPSNYLCELIFQRRGEYDNSAMPQWIWNSPKFKDWYIIELIRINRALHTYDIATLLIAFNETKVLSVKNPKFIVKCEEVALRPKKELTPSTVEVYKPRILPEQKDRMEGL